MNSQLPNERKQRSSSFSSLRVNKRVAFWFNKPSFFQFKMKSEINSPNHSPSSPKSRSSLSSDASLPCAQSPSTTTSKDSIIYDSTTVDYKKSSKVRRQTSLDAEPSKFETPIAIHSTSKPIHSTAPAQPTPGYRQPIPNFFASIPSMVPGVCS